jgi:hypothetical protein
MPGQPASLLHAAALVLQVPLVGGHCPSAKQDDAVIEHWPASVGQLPSFWQSALESEHCPSTGHWLSAKQPALSIVQWPESVGH